jgi:hypothetical protein
LITEAGPLTYPENASTDELNTVIKVKGSRSRRFGIDFEPSSTAATITGLADGDFVSEYAWKGVGNDSSVNFLVVQINYILYFYNLDATPISGSQKSFSFDIRTYRAPYASDSDIASTPVQMASGKGWLFVVSPFIDPFLIDYDKAGDTFSTLRINLLIRDFDGIEDSLSNEDQPTTLTKEHLYNLRNQGWVSPGTGGVLEGAGTTDPYTAPTPPTTNKEQYYDPYDGNKYSYL